MSDFWSHFYFKKTGIEHTIIFYNNKFYLICSKANSKFPISRHAESPEVVDINNNLSMQKNNHSQNWFFILSKNSNIIHQEFINHTHVMKYLYTEIIAFSTHLKLEIKNLNNLIVKKY